VLENGSVKGRGTSLSTQRLLCRKPSRLTYIEEQQHEEGRQTSIGDESVLVEGAHGAQPKQERTRERGEGGGTTCSPTHIIFAKNKRERAGVPQILQISSRQYPLAKKAKEKKGPEGPGRTQEGKGERPPPYV